jgi:hypothetical protein
MALGQSVDGEAASVSPKSQRSGTLAARFHDSGDHFAAVIPCRNRAIFSGSFVIEAGFREGFNARTAWWGAAEILDRRRFSQANDFRGEPV